MAEQLCPYPRAGGARRSDYGGTAMADVAEMETETAEGAAPAPARRQRNRRRSPLRRIAGLLRPYAGRLVIAALLLVLSSSLGLVFPLVIRSLLNSILGQQNAQLLNGVVVFLFVVFLAQSLVGAVEGYLVTALGERLSFDLRTLLSRHLQRLPLSFFDHRRTGELMSRVTNDVTLMQSSLTGNILPSASQVASVAGGLAITAAIN